MDDREFSAIYESIDDSGSDPDEYVDVSQQDPDPGPYLLPEPMGAPPPPPPDSPPPPSPTSGPGVGPWNMNPLPLPRKPPPSFQGAPGKKQKLVQKAPSQRPLLLKKPQKPKLPPKPAAGGIPPTPPTRPRAGLPAATPTLPRPSTRRDYRDHQPWGLPTGDKGGAVGGAERKFTNQSPTIPYPNPLAQQQQQQQNFHGRAATEEAEYESIKETRKMLAARRKHQEKKAKEMQAEREGGAESGWGDRGAGGGGWEQHDSRKDYIKMKRLSEPNFDGSSDSTEEALLGVVGEKSHRGRSKVVCIMLSITVVSLIIAVASLAAALFSITAVSRLPGCTMEYYHTSSRSTAEMAASNITLITTAPLEATKVSGAHYVVTEDSKVTF